MHIFVKNGYEQFVNVTINIDDFPLFKSSPDQLWPIVVKFGSHNPFLIALYFGKKNPSPFGDYLEDFIKEVNELTRESPSFNGV